MTAALLCTAFLKAADTLSDELNQQLIQKSAAGGGALFWNALPALGLLLHSQHTIQPF